MANISPQLQQRVRRLLQLTGGVEIEPIEAIQPVAVIASFAEGRQPQTEQGDTLIRRFTGGRAAAAGGAGTWATVGLRVSDPSTVAWVQRVTIINDTAGAVAYSIGRVLNQTAVAWGTAYYTDLRLPGVDIGASVIEVITSAPGALPQLGGARVSIVAGSHVSYPVDFIVRGPQLAGTPNPEMFGVTIVNTNTATSWITIEGVLYTVLDRDRP